MRKMLSCILCLVFLSGSVFAGTKIVYQVDNGKGFITESVLLLSESGDSYQTFGDYAEAIQLDGIVHVIDHLNKRVIYRQSPQVIGKTPIPEVAGLKTVQYLGRTCVVITGRSNPDDELWLDAETGLQMYLRTSCCNGTGHRELKALSFDRAAIIDGSVFIPRVPEGYSVAEDGQIEDGQIPD